MSEALNRQALLATTSIPLERVEVPEWGLGAFVNVGMMTAAEYDALYRTREGEGEGAEFPHGFLSAFASYCIRDESGARLLTNADIPALSQKAIAPIKRVCDTGMRINGIGENVAKELEKNSGEVPSASSDSGLPLRAGDTTLTDSSEN